MKSMDMFVGWQQQKIKILNLEILSLNQKKIFELKILILSSEPEIFELES